jgi:acetyltransferase-like isoleucine patch superfamily enzyme
VTAPVLEHDWYPVPVPANVEVGPGSWLYSAFAFLHYRSQRPVGLRVGRNTGIYIDTLFDLGPHGEVDIGDHCTLAGPIFCTRGRVAIGNRVLISSRVLVADDPFSCPPGNHVPDLGAGHSPPAVVEIGDDAWIGTGATLLAGARIGAGGIVGAATVVDFEVPEMTIVGGDPARIIGRSD